MPLEAIVFNASFGGLRVSSVHGVQESHVCGRMLPRRISLVCLYGFAVSCFEKSLHCASL